MLLDAVQKVSELPKNSVGSRLQPPDADEVEVTLLGPGYGESVVVHLGAGQWLIVDSCIGEDGDPAPLAYLSQLGVGPEDVIAIVATHWHDDHVRGLARVVEACQSAKVFFSAAVQTADFLVLTADANDRAMMTLRSGVEEFAAILDLIRSGQAGRRPLIEYGWALADQRLLLLPDGGTPAEVWALSPSSEDLTRALLAIGNLADEPAGTRRRVPPPPTNDGAVALHLQVGDVRCLLGADLEVFPGDDTRGWSAVLGSTSRPQEPASLFKIPHHGSTGAYLPAVWSEMLEDEPTAMITPFRKGSVVLPTPEGRNNVCAQTTDAWITQPHESTNPRVADRRAVKTIKEAVRWMRPIELARGFVTARRVVETGASWDISLHPPAGPLCPAP